MKTVRDIFVFSCYTGMPYVDVVTLRSENLVLGLDKHMWIYTKRTKNKNAVKVPLLRTAKDIIEEYRENVKTIQKQTLFPTISNQKMNAYLKEIAEKAGISKNVTFHMARHTFATTVTLNNGVPMETISKMLGHRKLSTTQIYAKVIEKKVSDDMQILKSKLYG